MSTDIELKKTNQKFFVYMFSQRRNFIPILSIYFLSIPNTTANQIWIFTWIWYLASLLLEIPSWYISDVFWHKETLIISKIFQLFSVFLYIIWWLFFQDQIFYVFILAFAFQSLWFSFFSWTTQAFYHDVLRRFWKEKEYSKLKWKMSANVSLVSVLIIIALPFLTKIHIVLPLFVWLIFDVIWLIAIFFIKDVKKDSKIKDKKSIIQVLKDSRSYNILWFSIFLWFATGIFLAENSFRWPYLESLWYPIMLLWFVMWVSRIVWFLVWNNLHIIEKHLTPRLHFLFEVFLFTLYYFSISYFSNPYLVWLIISIVVWYAWWRKPVIEWYVLKNVWNTSYKASFLSLEAQVNAIVWTIFSFIIWFLMNYYSYKIWYFLVWIITFIFLSFIYYFMFLGVRDKENLN